MQHDRSGLWPIHQLSRGAISQSILSVRTFAVIVSHCTSRTPGLRSGADFPSNVSRCIRRNTIATIPQFHPPSAATLKVRFATCGNAVCLKVMTLPCLLLCASARGECHINRLERRDAAGKSFPVFLGLHRYPQFLKDIYIVHLFKLIVCYINKFTQYWQNTTNGNRHICWCVTSQRLLPLLSVCFLPAEHVELFFVGSWSVWEVTCCNLGTVSVGLVCAVWISLMYEKLLKFCALKE